MKTKKPKIILLGPQASGKGTQSHILSTWSGAPKMSMGDLLREIQNEDSDRGKTVKELISKGSLVPDDIILDIIKDWIKKNSGGWVIDGFPRTMEQAQKSWDLFRPDAVIFLDLPDDVAKRRLSYRRVCSKCKTNYNLITNPPKNDKHVCDLCGGELIQREDDKPEVVEDRLKTYHTKTEPIKEWYRAKGVLLEVDAKPGIPAVAHEIQKMIQEGQEVKKEKGRKKLWIFAIIGIVLAILGALIFIGSLQA